MPALGGDVDDAADKRLDSLKVPVLSTAAAIRDFASDVGGTVETILNIASAYNECDSG